MSRPVTTPTLPARLATGDWVVLARADAGPLGFLGKVTDGEWDPRDDALLRARVDTTRSKPVWFAAGDLERVSPSDEAALVELALERGLVPEERAARLRADADALRDRRLTFVRSPGLLDRLWAALPADPEQRTGGLAAFLDEGRRLLLDARHGRRTPLAPPARSPDPEPRPTPLPAPARLPRVLTHEEAVVRILEALPLPALLVVRTRLLGDGPVEAEEGSMQAVVLQGLLTAEPTLPSLLEALPEGTLETLLPILGYPKLRAGRKGVHATLAGHLCGILRAPRRAPAPTLRPPAPPVQGAAPGGLDQAATLLAAGAPSDALQAIHAPTRPTAPKAPDRPQPPTSLAEATTRILGVVRGPQLPALCDRLGVPRPTWSDPGEARANIVAAGRPLRDLVAALPPSALGHLGYLLGVPRGAGTDAELAAHVLARAEPRLEAAPHLALLLEALPDEARRPFVRDLGAVAPEAATVDGLVAALLAADVTPLEVLDALQPREVARAARRFGLASAADPVAALRALVTRPAETP